MFSFWVKNASIGCECKGVCVVWALGVGVVGVVFALQIVIQHDYWTKCDIAYQFALCILWNRNYQRNICILCFIKVIQNPFFDIMWKMFRNFAFLSDNTWANTLITRWGIWLGCFVAGTAITVSLNHVCYSFWRLGTLRFNLRVPDLQMALRWCHNDGDSVSNHQPHDCLLSCLFGRKSKKTSKLRVTGLCVGNSPGTGEFPAQMASNAENVSIWWRHHG